MCKVVHILSRVKSWYTVGIKDVSLKETYLIGKAKGLESRGIEPRTSSMLRMHYTFQIRSGRILSRDILLTH